MTSVLVADEAASHLGAILLAFNREIFASCLDEADDLARLGLTAPAILIAGTVLEFVERSPAAAVLPSEQRSTIDEWRQLRNQVAHGAITELNVSQARQIIVGIRQILAAAHMPAESSRNPRKEANAARAIKGKYAHVATTSCGFISRKGEELELEDRG